MTPPIDHFGILAPFYERFIRPKVSQTFWRLVDALPGQSLLDAGGGTGRVSQVLIGQGIRVVVADESPEMLREASLKEGLLPLHTLTERLPFADETFERIIMVDALHHVAHQQRTAEELFRVLKPGGRLVIEEPNVDLFAVKLLALGDQLLLMRSHFLNPRRMAELFSAHTAAVHLHHEDGTAWVLVEK
mgnify:FL=1